MCLVVLGSAVLFTNNLNSVNCSVSDEIRVSNENYGFDERNANSAMPKY